MLVRRLFSEEHLNVCVLIACSLLCVPTQVHSAWFPVQWGGDEGRQRRDDTFVHWQEETVCTAADFFTNLITEWLGRDRASYCSYSPVISNEWLFCTAVNEIWVINGVISFRSRLWDWGWVCICVQWRAVAVLTGTSGTMAESEFQWSLHRVDSHKSPACVCGVGAEVRQLWPTVAASVMLVKGVRPPASTDTSLCFVDMGCQSTSRPCCFSPTRRTWRSWGRCCTTSTNIWTAVLQSLMWAPLPHYFKKVEAKRQKHEIILCWLLCTH